MWMEKRGDFTQITSRLNKQIKIRGRTVISLLEWPYKENMQKKKIKIGIVGISFGMEFVPIYQKHPHVESVAIADFNSGLLSVCAEKFSIPERDCYRNLDEMLKDSSIDAVHICTPPSSHAGLSIKALNAGRHCGCTIPMGMSIEELYEVIKARKKSGKNYMFLETTVFGREFFYVQEMYKKGELGKIQYMTCAHYQDMEGWPEYWEGFPPLMHPTHAVGPCLLLLDKNPVSVYGVGSGRVRDS